MDVPVITMDQDAAEVDLKEYAASLRRSYDAEREAVYRGLEALAQGKRVLSLRSAMAQAGFDEAGLPRLAIARADRQWCRLEIHGNRSTMLFDAHARRHGARWETLEVRCDLGESGREHFAHFGVDLSGWSWMERWAMVPMIPALGVRLAGGASKLREHFVLWEVEEWHKRQPGAEPPFDPYLLRPLGGDLYTVVYEWDLTELERAVMAGRAVE